MLQQNFYYHSMFKRSLEVQEQKIVNKRSPLWQQKSHAHFSSCNEFSSNEENGIFFMYSGSPILQWAFSMFSSDNWQLSGAVCVFFPSFTALIPLRNNFSDLFQLPALILMHYTKTCTCTHIANTHRHCRGTQTLSSLQHSSFTPIDPLDRFLSSSPQAVPIFNAIVSICSLYLQMCKCSFKEEVSNISAIT